MLRTALQELASKQWETRLLFVSYRYPMDLLVPTILFPVWKHETTRDVEAVCSYDTVGCIGTAYVMLCYNDTIYGTRLRTISFFFIRFLHNMSSLYCYYYVIKKQPHHAL